MKNFLLLLVIILLTGCAQLIAPRVKTQLQEMKGGEFQVDKTHASLLFKVGHLSLSNYVGRMNSFDASLDFDPTQMQNTRLSARVDMSSVDTGNPEMDQMLVNDQWFDTGTYPFAQFETLSVTVSDDDSFLFTGTLSWRGVSQPVTLQVKFLGAAQNMLSGKYTLGFSAKGYLKRSDFGVDKYQGLVADQVELLIDAEFQKK